MSEDKKYVHVSRDTVHIFAEQSGIQDVKDEACGMVAEDCGYRLREATALAAQFMRKNRRKKLTTEDFNKALKAYDVEPFIGYGSPPSTTWKTIPRDSIASPEGTAPLYFADDRDLNVVASALSAATISNVEAKAPLSVTAHWLTQEQYPRILTPAGVTTTNAAATSSSSSSMSPSLTSASSSPQPHGSPTRKPLSSAVAVQQKKINDALLAYYDLTTKAILGKEETVMKVALEDLRTNPRIAPLLPYFINFVSAGVKTVSHDASQLRKLLHTAKAILLNRRLDLTPKPYLELIVTSVTYCLMEPLGTSVNGTNDHWSLRDYASQVLAIVINGWGIKLPYLKEQVLKTLQDVILDSSRPFCSVYGAIAGLSSLGSQVIESHLLSHLNSCMSLVDNHRNHPATKLSHLYESDYVKGALIAATEKYLKIKSQEFRSDVVETMRKDAVDRTINDEEEESERKCKRDEETEKIQRDKVGTDVNKIYRDAYRHFGSSLAARLDMVMNRPRLKRDSKPTPPTKLYEDSGEEKSGDQMLNELRRQAAAAEEAKKRLKTEEEEDDDDEEDEDEERSYESDEKSDPNGEYGDESLVVKSHISDPGQGIKLTLKLTKRSRTETPSSVASGDGVDPLAPPHKKKKRSRGSRESSAHLSGGGTPSPAASPRAFAEPVFQRGDIVVSRPPTFNFQVLGMNQRETWDLARAPRWNFDVISKREPVFWKKSGDLHQQQQHHHHRKPSSTTPVLTGKMKKLCDKNKLFRASRSCSLFTVL